MNVDGGKNMNAPALITITPVRVADLLADGEQVGNADWCDGD